MSLKPLIDEKKRKKESNNITLKEKKEDKYTR